MGLVGRILTAGAVVVAFLLLVFVAIVVGTSRLGNASDHERTAQRSIVAATRFEKLVLDLETGQRGYVLTGDATFLTPWREARADLPGAERELLALAEGTEEEPAARRLVALERRYLRTWAIPVVAQARSDPARARARVHEGVGKQQVDAIRTEVAHVVATANEVAASAERRLHTARRRGLAIGVAGIVIVLLLFVGVVAYFLRAAIQPMRRLAVATTHLSRGNLDTRVDEAGAGEVSQLARAFNQMATSLQRSQAALEQQVSVTRSVLDSTVDGICLTDAEGNVVLANRPLLQFVSDLSLPLGGSVQENLLAVADRFDDPDLYRAQIGRITADLDEATMDEFSLAENGRCFQGFTAPLHDASGALSGRVWTLREVTAERAADRLKDEFIATVSHELRTPLTSIVGFVEMLLAGDAGSLTDEQRRFLEIVMRSSHRLMRQVGDLLFIAQLDSAGLALQRGDVDLAPVVREAVDQASALARQRELELSLDVPEALVARCDRERIAQVLSNLLANAVKFTPPGGRIAVRLLDEGDSATIEVEDSGIGIPEAERDRLFQRFFRSSRATEHAIQGTGLGLAISHAIVEAHGGSIAARPAAERGTVFSVSLPLAVPVEA
jgi:signal transduction histidine kinase